MKDFLGNELQVGDRVAMIVPYTKYSLGIGEITKIGPKKVTVEYVENHQPEYLRSTTRYPEQVVKEINL